MSTSERKIPGNDALSEERIMYSCPCCGYRVFEAPSGSYDICPICCWEDDSVQLAFPDMAGGANNCSLLEGQRNYEEFEVCEASFKTNVRTPSFTDIKDPTYRRLNPAVVRNLTWDNRQDRRLWDKAKNLKSLCLYYWSPDYWLLQQPP